jgi:hypothetical protein
VSFVKRLLPDSWPSVTDGQVGVGHPKKSLADVRRVDARRAQIRRRAGVVLSFQVSEYSIEPVEGKFARNLLANDNWRRALANEREPDRPKVAIVAESLPLSSVAEGLAGAAPGPDGAVFRPAREGKRERPAADSAKEVTLSESRKFAC